MNVDGLLISSGLSSRMGKLKPLLKYNGDFFITHIISKMLNVCGKIAVVLGHESDKIKSEIKFNKDLQNNRIIVCFNPDYEKGMFTSLQRGLKEFKNSKWILYHFVDQPGIPSKFYNEFVNKVDDKYDWIQPMYKARKGHPIILGRKIANEIINSPIDSNLRVISNKAKFIKKFWICNHKEILQDVDTPKEYNELLNN